MCHTAFRRGAALEIFSIRQTRHADTILNGYKPLLTGKRASPSSEGAGKQEDHCNNEQYFKKA
jgi:hypothetical protein